MSINNKYHCLQHLTRVAKKYPDQETLLHKFISFDLDGLAAIAIEVTVAEGSPLGKVLARVFREKAKLDLGCRLIKLIPPRSLALRDLELEIKRRFLEFLRRPASAKTRNDADFKIVDAMLAAAAVRTVSPTKLRRNIRQWTKRCKVRLLHDLAVADIAAGRLQDSLVRATEALHICRQLRIRHSGFRILQLRLLLMQTRLYL